MRQLMSRGLLAAGLVAPATVNSEFANQISDHEPQVVQITL